MAATAIMDFGNCEILLVNEVRRAEMHHHAKFHQKQSIHCRDTVLFQDGGCHPWRLLGRIVQNFGYDWCSGFDNVEVSIFGMTALKTPIHAPKIGVLCQFNLLIGVHYEWTIKRHILAWVHVVWAIKCKNFLTGLTCRCVPKNEV